MDMWDDGIKVLVVYPGVVDTPLFTQPDNDPFTAPVEFITVGELVQWTVMRKWGQARRAELAACLLARPPLPYSNTVARRWGEISARAMLRGRPRPANDTWIAACCLVHDLPLATLNRKDFEDFAEHEGLRLLGS
jgi:predicted nucleic acid-binding protein